MSSGSAGTAAVIETSIRYPTNNSLVWERIKERRPLLKQPHEEIRGMGFEGCREAAKKMRLKINAAGMRMSG
jgi:IS5 family transposase